MTTHLVLVNAAFLLFGVSVYLIKWLSQKPAGRKLPGPKGLPLIGNVFDLPAENEWLTFAKWGEQYGDVTSVTVFGQQMLILNTHDAAVNMLDKKSSIYSDRPHLPMASEIVGFKDLLVLSPYGDRFKSYRRMMHKVVGVRSNMDRFAPIQEAHALKCVRRMLDDPQEFRTHIRRGIGAIILMISHGYNVQDENDPMVELADKVTDSLGVVVTPGKFLVDTLPFLKFIPEWIPGASFQKFGREWRRDLSNLVDHSYDFVQKQLAAGTAIPSFTSNILEEGISSEYQESCIKWTAASLYSGGADTPVSALSSFIMALTMYPETLKKAHAEIDAVVGNDRLPGFSDKDQLPYVGAMVKELLRWCPVTPLGAPHRLVTDDMHNGYFLPKGTIVLANLWQFLHDPAVYSDPLVYNPDRLLPSDGKPAERDPYDFCYGYGRRTCPGSHVADSFLYIFIATIVSVFDVEKVVENGVVQEPKYEFTSGNLTHPKFFKCSIKPRSAKAEALIRSLEELR